MTTAKILAIVAALVSLPSLALAQTVVIVVPSPYSGGYAQPYSGGYVQPYSAGYAYAQPYAGGYSYAQPYSGYYAYAPTSPYVGYAPGYVYGWQRW